MYAFGEFETVSNPDSNREIRYTTHEEEEHTGSSGVNERV